MRTCTRIIALTAVFIVWWLAIQPFAERIEVARNTTTMTHTGPIAEAGGAGGGTLKGSGGTSGGGGGRGGGPIK